MAIVYGWFLFCLMFCRHLCAASSAGGSYITCSCSRQSVHLTARETSSWRCRTQMTANCQAEENSAIHPGYHVQTRSTLLKYGNHENRNKIRMIFTYKQWRDLWKDCRYIKKGYAFLTQKNVHIETLWKWHCLHVHSLNWQSLSWAQKSHFSCVILSRFVYNLSVWRPSTLFMVVPPKTEDLTELTVDQNTTPCY